MSLLAHHSRNEGLLIERWKPNGVTPLEIWDLIIEDKNLWEWQDDPGYPEILFEALIRLRAGDIESESKGAIDPVVRDFDSLFVTGGRSQSLPLRESLERIRIPTCFGANPVHGACVSAVDAFKASKEKLLAIDVGQTQIKIAFEDEVAILKRDLSILPSSESAICNSLEDQRSLLTEYISTSIQSVLTEIKYQPDKVLLALPCFIRPHFALGGSSYSGMKEHPSLLRDVIGKTGLTGTPWLITNDAELAALPALSVPTFANAGRTLVLTLGFGTGACVLEH